MNAILAAQRGALLSLPLPASAHRGIHVTDPFARFIGPSGAACFRITSHAHADDRRVSASSPDAGMVMIISSGEDANGVMKMQDLPDGIPVAGETSQDVAPGGGRVMPKEPTHPAKKGGTVPLTLVFAQAGPVTPPLRVADNRQDPPTDHDAAGGEGLDGGSDAGRPEPRPRSDRQLTAGRPA